jgi:hypothetical protein
VIPLCLIAGIGVFLMTRHGADSPTSTASYLHTEGTRIIDSEGHTVQLTGYNVVGMDSNNPEGTARPGICHDGYKPVGPRAADILAGYGLHTVRVAVAWGNVEPRAPTVTGGGGIVHHWNAPYLQALAYEIGLLGAHHISVILDMQESYWSPAFTSPASSKVPGCPGSGMPVWLNPLAQQETYQTAACKFYSGVTEPGVPGTAWSDFAAAESYLDHQYLGDPTVIGQDLVNEPFCYSPSADLEKFYSYVAPIVHRSNPHLLLVLEDRDGPGTFAVTSLPRVPGIVLSVHLKESNWNDPSQQQPGQEYSGLQAVTADLRRSETLGVPLYVGEFYAFDGVHSQANSIKQDTAWQQDTAAFLQFAAVHHVSWTYWAFLQKAHPRRQPYISPALIRILQNG